MSHAATYASLVIGSTRARARSLNRVVRSCRLLVVGADDAFVKL
jgi:hypothetical protein